MAHVTVPILLDAVQCISDKIDKAVTTLPIYPLAYTSCDGDGRPIHNTDNLAIRCFFSDLDPLGYKKEDHSKVWRYTRMVQDQGDPSWTEEIEPYIIFGSGDTLIVECDTEPTQTLTPYKGKFYVNLLTPGKVYRWTMKKSGKVIQTGEFRTVGTVRWIGTKYPHNFRDIGGFGLNYERVYRSMNFAKIEVDSDDHRIIRDHLNITTQLNLTSVGDEKSPSRTDIFERCYNYNIPAYAALLTASTQSKANFKSAFEVLVSELKAGHNVVFNCWQGADRTGTFDWFIHAICGVPLGYCEGLWELTGFVRDCNSKIWDWEEESGGGMRTFMTKLIDKYKAATKETTYDSYRLAYYLATKVIGISATTIADFRTIMLVPVQ